MTPEQDRRRMAYLTRVIRHGKPKNRPNTERPIVHGTRHAFRRRGCRCEVCVQAERLYWREYRAKPKTWPDWAHGRATTYDCGCRCGLCRRANAEVSARWRARNRPPKVASPIETRRADRLEYFRQRYRGRVGPTAKPAIGVGLGNVDQPKSANSRPGVKRG